MTKICWVIHGLTVLLAWSEHLVDAKDPGVVEVDLVFPRNDTYTFSESMPVVFAVQNPYLADFLQFRLSYEIWNSSIYPGRNGLPEVAATLDLQNVSLSSENPYFAHHSLPGLSERRDFPRDGQWILVWSLWWANCSDATTQTWAWSPYDTFGISDGGNVEFTIKYGDQTLDLVVATSSQRQCPPNSGHGKLGVAINVTGQTKLLDPSRNSFTGCAILAPSPTPTPRPCQVSVDAATAASMSAVWHEELCHSHWAPKDCKPNRENSSQRSAVIDLLWLCLTVGSGILVLVPLV
jgi:hypothetical protein